MGRWGRSAFGLSLLAFAATAPHLAAHASAGLQYVSTVKLGPRLEELTFRTPALAGTTKVRVLLPSGYDPSGRTRYPVLFLLNGANDDYRSWTDKGQAEASTASYPLIVVMPDGGAYGNYTDWYNGGAGGPPMWETYHIGQLLPWIDAHLPTVGQRDGRAVAGLSMGGGGAVAYAARHPDLFSAVGSFSGAVDTNNLFVIPLTETSGIADGHAPGSVYGPRLTDEIRWRGHNGWDLAANLRGMLIQVDTGNGSPGGPGGDTGDPVEAGVHQMSVAFHEQLQALGIAHIWDDYGAGGHAWFYWQRDLRQFLPRLMDRFRHPVDPPLPQVYRTTDAQYRLYGFRVTIARPAVEWSEFSYGGNQFTLRGSGTADVTTGPFSPPGDHYLARIDSASGTSIDEVIADDTGRVHVTVALGPPNPYQEDTLQGRQWMVTSAISANLGGIIGEAQRWPVYSATVTITRVVS